MGSDKILRQTTIETLREYYKMHKRSSINLDKVLDSHEALRARLAAAEAVCEAVQLHDLYGDVIIALDAWQKLREGT